MRKRLLALLAAVVFSLAAGSAGAGIPVAVTIAPQAWFLERLGGDRLEVQVLVRPGQDPHTYQPTPAQMTRLARAQAYFCIGMPLEQALVPRLKGLNPGLRVVDTNRGIRLRHLTGPGHHHHLDPHTWLDPNLARVQAANICAALQELDPPQRQTYARNQAVLEAELASLDRRIRGLLAPFRGRSILVFHPALGYFARAYGLEQRAIQQEGKPPGPRRLAQLLDLARRQGIKVVFVEPQFPRSRARALARSLGARVEVVDPLARDYAANLLALARAIAGSFR